MFVHEDDEVTTFGYVLCRVNVFCIQETLLYCVVLLFIFFDWSNVNIVKYEYLLEFLYLRRLSINFELKYV